MNELFNRLANPLIKMAPFKRKVIKVIIDSCIIFISFQLAYFLRFDWAIPAIYAKQIVCGGLTLMAFTIAAFIRLGAYSDFWVYWSLGLIGAVMVEFINARDGNTIGIGLLIYLIILILFDVGEIEKERRNLKNEKRSVERNV